MACFMPWLEVANLFGCKGEAMRIATDKLLFLSERAFADEEPEDHRTSEG